MNIGTDTALLHPIADIVQRDNDLPVLPSKLDLVQSIRQRGTAAADQGFSVMCGLLPNGFDARFQVGLDVAVNGVLRRIHDSYDLGLRAVAEAVVAIVRCPLLAATTKMQNYGMGAILAGMIGRQIVRIFGKEPNFNAVPLVKPVFLYGIERDTESLLIAAPLGIADVQRLAPELQNIGAAAEIHGPVVQDRILKRNVLSGPVNGIEL